MVNHDDVTLGDVLHAVQQTHAQVTALDKTVKSLDQKVESLDQRVEHLDQRVGHLENKFENLDNKFESFKTETKERFDKIEPMIDDTHTNIEVLVKENWQNKTSILKIKKKIGME
ncbi:hypothetical protein [Tuberibacillus sp. Marseille-P3662]|uniref:hypothetical protein n=1 Tax=Tuberibacillus sp. Marseille-P3662 TaxID=1965358 RepID=UPI000A1CD8ED|nr:hypothetical protein [Tuberibacillus sp. Marseille-P3662]